MIDFHAHILPKIDDGPKHLSDSLSMLKHSYEQGVGTVVSTSHCYVTDEARIDAFLAARARSYRALREAMDSDGGPFPNIVLGAEVHLYKDISHYENLPKLCIEGTNYLLVEMPYTKWNNTLYDSLYSMQLKHLRPILAHIERYAAQEDAFENLFSLDLLYQVNADSFLHSPEKRFLAKLFDKNAIQLLGSDMHNLTSRPSRMQKAAEHIGKVYGQPFLEYIQNNAEAVLENRDVLLKSFPRLSFWDKLKL
ncbi:MAG TPA: hypothetical protein IAB04_01675 [Candidatus Avimonoglobus intestinipullorum]|uniref:protein-tyrosine-phosphatase n=1 Tax=Candidatus Avimonoglobus intestinipullorum TaxID=2840699 RepID=A0A9D1LU58_9FIRM|nr:hypothetical protein [Candidatus Avimonoglobus intestinipullorum]